MEERVKVIIASNNAHKIDEIKAIVKDFGFDVISLSEAGIDIDIEETGTTFRENALIKAETIVKMTGRITISDDSGLEVYALNGAPGVYSARYSGEHGNTEENNAKLLRELKDVKYEDRRARFVSYIVMAYPDGRRIYAPGYAEGIIITEGRGSNGFGYDPLFFVPELGKTFAELTPAEKNSISHRSMALKELKRQLQSIEQQ